MYSRIDVRFAIHKIKQLYDLNFNLKEKQLDVIEHLVNKQHVFSILPTGYGKSLTFAFPPLILDQLESNKRPHIALVVSPLKSLMINQVSSWRERGVTCAALGMVDEADSNLQQEVKNGKCSILFASPEAILAERGRELLNSSIYKEKLCLVAFDEAHCITEWGDDFRPIYKEVSLLRSIASNSPVLALTATCTQAMMTDIMKHLLLAKQPVETVAALPDRPNLMLHVKKTRSIESELSWYITELKENGKSASKAIIYCRSMTHAADLYAHIMYKVGDSAWLTVSNKDPSKRLVDMYHRSSPNIDQQRVTSEFPKQESNIRCVIATIAFGMGVQINDVKYVFHYGCSKSPLSYWQEVGRCSRNGEQGHCYMFLTPNSLHPQRVTEKMIQICRAEEHCLRIGILENLVVSGMDISGLEVLKNRSSCNGDCDLCKCSLCSCCSRCCIKCQCYKN